MRFTGTGLPAAGLKWSYCGNAGPNEKILSASNHARMLWVQPDTITVRWFCVRAFGRSDVTNVGLEIRQGSTGATPDIDLSMSAAQITTIQPVKAGPGAAPWAYWDMGQEYTFTAGTTYIADFYPKQGNISMTMFEQTKILAAGREHAVGNAYYGATKQGSNNAWSMAWLEKSFYGGATPYLPWMVRPA